MITFYNPHHALHQRKLEMFRGELVPCFEVPARVDYVLQELRRRHTWATSVLRPGLTWRH